jgi:chain length determinant protein (polysaccharide antigen chain regulator)
VEEVYKEDLNLLDFLQILWQQKRLIFLTTALSVLLGVVYLLLATPIYEAIGAISPPTKEDFALLNQGHSNAKNTPLLLYTVKEVYGIFIKNLQAESTKKLFFHDVLSNSLLIKKINSRPTSPSLYRVSVRGVSPRQDTEWVKNYIALAKQKALNEILADVEHQRHVIVRNLQDKIATMRAVANTERLDRIQQLQEAIKLARALGIKGGRNSSNKIIVDESTINNPNMMYLRGSIALQAELDNLAKRDSADTFVSDKLKLGEIQSKLAFYKKIVIKPSDIVMFKLDRIVKPDVPISPNKKLILLLAPFSGLILGSILVLIRL